MPLTLQELFDRARMTHGTDYLQTLTKHLRRRLGHIPKCPLCNHTTLTVAGPSGQVITGYEVTQTGRIEASGALLPLIALVCNRCAHVMQFSWGQVLVQTQDPEDAGGG